MNNSVIKKRTVFKSAITLKQQLVQYNLLYTVCFISLLDVVFGNSGWLAKSLPMSTVDQHIYAPSMTAIFCLLGLAPLSLRQGQPAIQGQLKPYISGRKLIAQLDFMLLAIYAFYFMLLSLFLPYINIFLHLIFQKESFIKGYTLFSAPLESLMNAIGVFLVFYFVSLCFYFVSVCWAKYKIYFLVGNIGLVLLLYLTPVADFIAQKLKQISWDSSILFMFILCIGIFFMALLSYAVQRKWEV